MARRSLTLSLSLSLAPRPAGLQLLLLLVLFEKPAARDVHLLEGVIYSFQFLIRRRKERKEKREREEKEKEERAMGSDERKEHGHRHKKRRHKHRRHHDRDDDENEDDEGKRSGGKTHHHHRRHHVSSSSSSRHHHRHLSSKQDQQGNHFVEKKKQEQQPEVAKYSGDIEKIDSTDYFLKNPEFCSYLVEARQTYFGELTSETARKLFDEFVLLWNSKSLASKYYEGIGGGAQVPRTRPTSASISRKKRQLVEERESDYSRREAERLRGKDLRR